MPHFSSLVYELSRYGYVLLVPAAIVEGPIVAFIAGFLISLGVFSIVPTTIILFLGDFLPDTFFYFLGFYGYKKPRIKKYFATCGLNDQKEKFIALAWHSHPLKTIVFSKAAYGISIPFLISAGITKFPYRKFIGGVMMFTIVQFGSFLALGYYFGSSYRIVGERITDAGICAAFAAIIILFFTYRRFAKKLSKDMARGI